MNLRRICCLLLLPALCVQVARADFRLQYLVSYGIYPHWAVDTTTSSPGTGFLANNGTGRALIQLIWAGFDDTQDTPDAYNTNHWWAGGDDLVLENRYIEMGLDGCDEWGVMHALPPPYVSSNSLRHLVFIRVWESIPPFSSVTWYYDTPLIAPDQGSSDMLNTTVVFIDGNGDSMPASGIQPNQQSGGLEEPIPTADPSPDPRAGYVEFDPEAMGCQYSIPYNYTLSAVYGAETLLESGGWDWHLLTEGVDYSVSDGIPYVTDDIITFQTTGDGIPTLRMIRLGFGPGQ